MYVPKSVVFLNSGRCQMQNWSGCLDLFHFLACEVEKIQVRQDDEPSNGIPHAHFWQVLDGVVNDTVKRLWVLRKETQIQIEECRKCLASCPFCGKCETPVILETKLGIIERWIATELRIQFSELEGKNNVQLFSGWRVAYKKSYIEGEGFILFMG